MVRVDPSRIPGRWRDGFVLDYHIVRSTYLGDDEFGHPIFDTERTEIGELLYRLKYRSDTSVVDEIVRCSVDFLRSWNRVYDLIIPVPPSSSGRPVQPVSIIAAALGEQLVIPVRFDAVVKKRDIPPIKNVYNYNERLRLLEGAYNIDTSIVAGRRVLLFDDLYRSGATMNTITMALYDIGSVSDVFAFAITRTRSRL